MSHADAGPRDAPAVVLLPAYSFTSEMWREQTADLSADGYRVVTIDHPGFGRLAATELDPHHPHVDHIADGAAGVLRRLGIQQATVIGASLGGYVTMALIRRHPHLVRAAGLMASRIAAANPNVTAIMLRQCDQMRSPSGMAEFRDWFFPTLVGATTRAQRPDIAATVTAAVASPDQYEAMARLWHANALRPDETATFLAFGGPFRFFVGAEDERVSEARHLAALRQHEGRDTQVQVFDRVGHMPTYEAPKEVTAALRDFLSIVPLDKLPIGRRQEPLLS